MIISIILLRMQIDSYFLGNATGASRSVTALGDKEREVFFVTAAESSKSLRSSHKTPLGRMAKRLEKSGHTEKLHRRQAEEK